ncbi:MAG: hypothetical protein KBC95_01050 [Candidatus Peribacteraceae bacterium]|nr:hypothetical protein [Candidatus Peribacteraceae bacterium]
MNLQKYLFGAVAGLPFSKDIAVVLRRLKLALTALIVFAVVMTGTALLMSAYVIVRMAQGI